MLEYYPDRVKEFIEIAGKNNLEMILVGGGAVNFHGYQRHSADIDFWIKATQQNMQNLLKTLQDLGYNIQQIPDQVLEKQQNISIKISPVFELELITNFNPGKAFEEALSDSVKVEKDGLCYHVLSFNDLINSKISSPRPKDMLDIEELQRIMMKKNKANNNT